MKYRVSRRADSDLDGIWNYIARESVPAADRIDDEIHEAIEMLAAHPGMGHWRPDVRNEAYRFHAVYKYVIAYRTRGRTLIVVRVLHGARDFRRLFRRRTGDR